MQQVSNQISPLSSTLFWNHGLLILTNALQRLLIFVCVVAQGLTLSALRGQFLLPFLILNVTKFVLVSVLQGCIAVCNDLDCLRSQQIFLCPAQ